MAKFVTCFHMYDICVAIVGVVNICWNTFHSARRSSTQQSKYKKYINHISNRISFRHQFTPLHFAPLFSFSPSFRFHFSNGAKVLIGVPWWQIRNNSCDKANIQANIYYRVCAFCSVNSWWWWFLCLLFVWRGAYRTHVEWVFFSSC